VTDIKLSIQSFEILGGFSKTSIWNCGSHIGLHGGALCEKLGRQHFTKSFPNAAAAVRNQHSLIVMLNSWGSSDPLPDLIASEPHGPTDDLLCLVRKRRNQIFRQQNVTAI
jgi:hypothetical protein